MRPFFSAILLLLGGCTGIPKDVKPVASFDLNQYLGTWHEIARLDHSFERGLSKVSAEYSLRKDGGVKVVNRGYSAKKNKWKEAVGRAYFVGNKDIGHLKVSFFGPFFGSYVIMELDHENYQYAMVCGPDRSYLWLLAREPQIDSQTQDRLLAKAKALGFDTSALIFANPPKVKDSTSATTQHSSTDVK